MNDNAYFKMIKSKIYNQNTSIYKLNSYERKLHEKLKSEKEEDNRIEVLLGKLYFEEKKYSNSIEWFGKAIMKNPNIISSYLGLFKCYVMTGDFFSAYKMINYYKGRMSDNKKYLECNIVISILEKILDYPSNIKEIDKNSYMCISFKNRKLSDTYEKFVDCYSRQEYSKCLSLLTMCENIARDNNIFLEFNTLSFLIATLKAKEDNFILHNLDRLYKELEISIGNNDFQTAVAIIKLVLKTSIKNDKLIYSSLYTLIKNGYYDELEYYVDKIRFKKDQSDIKNVLKNTIVNQRNFDNLSLEQKNVYSEAIAQGRICYLEADFSSAYDYYNKGYNATNQPIFIYYIAKMLYKNKNYMESMKYFEEYIKIGSDKVNKAYFYLAILNKWVNYEKGILYTLKVNKLATYCYNSDFVFDLDPKYDYIEAKRLRHLPKDIFE